MAFNTSGKVESSYSTTIWNGPKISVVTNSKLSLVFNISFRGTNTAVGSIARTVPECCDFATLFRRIRLWTLRFAIKFVSRASTFARLFSSTPVRRLNPLSFSSSPTTPWRRRRPIASSSRARTKSTAQNIFVRNTRTRLGHTGTR